MNNKLFFLFFAFNPIVCMDKFNHALKTSSETVKSLCADLSIDTVHVLKNEKEVQLLEPYVTTIEQGANKHTLQKKITQYLNLESLQNLQNITTLADYWHIPALLPLAIKALACKLSSDKELDLFQKNPEEYLAHLSLPRTILPIISHALLEKSPVKNDLLSRELKRTTTPVFSSSTDTASQYVINNDETMIAFVQDDKIKIVHLDTMKESVLHDSHYNSLVPCSFTKKSSSLICRTDDGLCIIPLQSPYHTIEINQPILLFDTSNDEQFLAAKSQTSGLLYCYDLSTGNEIISHEIPYNVLITAIKINPTNTFIATGHANGFVYYWKPQLGKPHKFVNHSGAINNIDFNHDSSLMATAGQDQAVCIWNLQTGTLHHRVTESAPIKTVNYNSVNNLLAALTQNGVVTLYSHNMEKIKTIAKAKQTNRSLSGSPQMRWSKKGDHLTYLHKNLSLQILKLINNDQQWTAHSIFSGLPIKNSSPSHIRLSNYGSHAIIYEKNAPEALTQLDLSQVPTLREKITHSPTIAQALALWLWHKNPEIFNQRPKMRILVENLDPLIKQHLDFNEQ